MLMIELYDYLFKIILSVILGGLIGVEREITHHWAGLRTHMLVCLGSTLFMFIAAFEYVSLQPGVSINLDATRLAAGVIMGIGFLGAGVIFKEGASVKGLTTAASIWITASVGLLVGIGKYELAIIGTIIILIVLYSDFIIEKVMFKSGEVMFLTIILKRKPNIQRRIENKIKRKKVNIYLIDFKRNEKTISIGFKAILPKLSREDLTRNLISDPDVIGVSWTE